MIFVLLFLFFVVFSIYWLIKKTIKFIIAPLFSPQIEVIEPMNTELKIEQEPLKVEIKPSNIDVSRIKEYTGEGVKSFIWYPQTWEQFIGQIEAKEQAKTIIKKARKGIRCHTIISAIQGHGKSTYIRLLTISLGARLIERVGKEINEDTLVDIINEINLCPEEQVIFFLDEIDTTDWKVLKLLNPCLQDFKISGKKIKPFCFCCATINKDLLIKTNPDLLDRIPHHIQFKRYTTEEIATIIKQYVFHLYPNEYISEEIVKTISENCKVNPRLSLGITEDFIVTQSIQKTLKDRRIVKDGLTEIDIKILQVLNQATKPMGANALALRVGLSQSQYEREYEPFLYEFSYIDRTPSRTISEKGLTVLKELKEEG